ncbi:MAG: PTS sugar transporter subunit IIC [Erysipelotrichaceae bacterium]|nr:PTS sugar transporter subunit IIC [Erysipelotrichaceae bacterium]
MKEALLVALAYWGTWMLDSITSNQTCTRPIVLGTVTGLLCGDLKTGITMGALLEAAYMGISGIGGALAADYRSATAIAVGLTILSGLSIEQGIAIASPIGLLCLSLMQVTIAISNLLEGFYMKALERGDVKKYNLIMTLHMLFVQHLVDTAVVFLCILFGTEAISAVFGNIPAWILNGLSAAGGMLVVVGLGLTTQAIWQKNTIVYVLLGFVLAKFVGLSTVVIAIIGVIIAYLSFESDFRFENLAAKKVVEAAADEEGDKDFYG